MRRVIFVTLSTAFVFLGCDEDAESPIGLDPREYIPGRGDDGRELVYEWIDEGTGEKVNIWSVSISPDATYAVFRIGYDDYLAKLDLSTKEGTVILYERTKSPDWSYDGQWIAFDHAGAGYCQ